LQNQHHLPAGQKNAETVPPPTWQTQMVLSAIRYNTPVIQKQAQRIYWTFFKKNIILTQQ
jgi:hypothetical protein